MAGNAIDITLLTGVSAALGAAAIAALIFC